VCTRSPVTLVSTDRAVGHAWSAAGNYSVNVTAISFLGCVTKMMPVQIHDVEECIPPLNLAVKADSNKTIDHTVTTSI